ncbi:hypothetical protein K402DRAFT_417037 [Aulographum hederae CBS 113979]|uniref:Pentatricopeptide repeat protein n=1 Tax=Aulographum hederae CBS 113979 TaxID=1176131 RepID=A0A6G1HD26_9PEZI|nr:hypothetical protein K402DRAFT_417037 [Aulographum hederae CBS 113979]
MRDEDVVTEDAVAADVAERGLEDGAGTPNSEESELTPEEEAMLEGSELASETDPTVVSYLDKVDSGDVLSRKYRLDSPPNTYSCHPLFFGPEFNAAWRKAFIKLEFAGRKNTLEQLARDFPLTAKSEIAIQKMWGPGGSSPRELRKNWARLHEDERANLWMPLICGVMSSKPREVLHALFASLMEPYPSFSYQSLLVDHVVLGQASNPNLPAFNVNSVVNVLHLMISLPPAEEPSASISAKVVRHLLERCTARQAHDLITAMVKREVLTPKGYVAAAKGIADYGDYHWALQLLEQGIIQGVRFDESKFYQSLHAILRAMVIDLEGISELPSVLATLKNMNVPITTQIFNVILGAAVQNKDLDAVLSLHNSTFESGGQIDEYHYSLVLQACKECKDADIVGTILERASSVAKSSEYVATQMLHCSYINDLRWRPDDALENLIKLFLQLFMPEPLIKLGLLSHNNMSNDVEANSMGRLTPSHASVHIVLFAFLRQCIATNYGHIHTIYKRFQDLASHNALGFTPNHYFYNVFMLAFGARSDTLRHCPEILRDMVQLELPDPPSLTSGGDEKGRTEAKETSYHIDPNLWTWSILSAAFLKHGQHVAAERVADFMRQKGLKENVVVASVMIKGYAEVGDVDAAVELLGQMGDADRAILLRQRSGLIGMRDQDKMRAALERSEKMREERRLWEREEAEQFKLGDNEDAAGGEATSDGSDAPPPPYVSRGYLGKKRDREKATAAARDAVDDGFAAPAMYVTRSKTGVPRVAPEAVKGAPAKDKLEKDTLEKDTLEKDTLEKDTLEKDTLEKDTLEKDT